MKKKLSLIFLLLISVVAVLFSSNPATVKADDNPNYIIENYHMDVEVALDNSYQITENITAKFGPSSMGTKRGIIRSLERRLKIIYGGKSITYYPTISHIAASVYVDGVGEILNAAFWENNGDYLDIVLGSESVFVNSKTVYYQISYNYKVGNDRYEDDDKFYYNLLGSDWDTTVSAFSFKVTFPEAVEEDNAEFYFGQYGASDEPSEKINYTINNNVVEGSWVGGDDIPAWHAVTMFMRFEEGYFSDVAPLSFKLDAVLLVITLLILIAIIVIVVITKSRAKKIYKPVEFYPPNGINPPEASYLNAGKITPKKMTSLIIYWASKGYLKIIQEDKKKIYLEKLSELEENAPAYEKNVFSKLFSNGQKVDLADNNAPLAEALYFASISVGSKFSNSITSSKSKSMAAVVVLIGLIPTLLMGLLYFVKTFYDQFFILSVFNIVGFAVLAVLFFKDYYKGKRFASVRRSSEVFAVLIIAAVILLVIIINSFRFQIDIMDNFGLKLIAPIVAGIAVYLSTHMLSLKPEILELFGRVQGFKDFIALAERDRIIALVEETPSYFYDILPYAYVFDITDAFSKKFEKIYFETSAYYDLRVGSFAEIIIITRLIDASMTTMLTRHIGNSTRSNRGGGGFGFGGGGGFSGGGFGGGGGRSW